jgi:hypothetical protein
MSKNDLVYRPTVLIRLEVFDDRRFRVIDRDLHRDELASRPRLLLSWITPLISERMGRSP